MWGIIPLPLRFLISTSEEELNCKKTGQSPEKSPGSNVNWKENFPIFQDAGSFYSSSFTPWIPDAFFILFNFLKIFFSAGISLDDPSCLPKYYSTHPLATCLHGIRSGQSC